LTKSGIGKKSNAILVGTGASSGTIGGGYGPVGGYQGILSGSSTAGNQMNINVYK